MIATRLGEDAEPILPDWIEAGRKLFAGDADFIWAASRLDGLPPPGPPEFAFAGRSNVGKSSLLNALTGRNSLARASHTPGRTQQLNFFRIGPAAAPEALRIVDMPGYGYAAVSKEKVAAWTRLMKGFLRDRATLKRAFLLIDGRHGLKSSDEETMRLLDSAAVPYQAVLTKRDEVRKADQDAMVAITRQGLSRHPAAHPDVFFVSSHTGEGIGELRAAIARQALDPRA